MFHQAPPEVSSYARRTGSHPPPCARCLSTHKLNRIEETTITEPPLGARRQGGQDHEHKKPPHKDDSGAGQTAATHRLVCHAPSATATYQQATPPILDMRSCDVADRPDRLISDATTT